ncbi:MAG: methyltransferase domain-containing protein [Bacteroidota bacterium]
MPNCCSTPSISESTGKFFSKRSKRYARSFRKGKLERIQHYLIEEICKEGLEGKTILDIGSGVGKLHLTLLRRGASFATGVDMSEEMIGHAKAFAKNFSVEQKTSYQHGDFLNIAGSIASADITMLDKVICCYEDLEGLISLSAKKTNTIYALIFPSNTFIVHLIFTLEIAFAKLFRSGFRPYWHEWNNVQTILTKQGFTRSYSRTMMLWQAAIYRREK